MTVKALAVIIALTFSTASLVKAETLTLCGQKVEYNASSNAGNLVGIWIGEIIAFNAAYSVDYSRCWALAIEDVSASGTIKSKLVLADNTKNMHNGTRYGTQGRVLNWPGQLGPGGATLRFASDDGRNSYDLQRQGETKMEGKVVYPTGTGRLFLVKQK
ncbi:hypothetical protein [Reyranella soli]|uniref:DUF2147 domain-containing protein n=1 Tax=Reyranella soli TaxID=1230389 RepID=A0A512NEG2_9HYPH|nr:hypothetical protein [Reyranella soli]GEP57333.1 hypothetical protein RSO01_44990 [Reyranella soli]